MVDSSLFTQVFLVFGLNKNSNFSRFYRGQHLFIYIRSVEDSISFYGKKERTFLFKLNYFVTDVIEISRSQFILLLSSYCRIMPI